MLFNPLTAASSTPSEPDIRGAAQSYLAVGLSVIPNRRDSKRPALAGWTENQSRLPTAAEVDEWFAAMPTPRLGIVTGQVSGHLEVLDFDAHGEAFDAWRALVREQALGLVERLVIERSPSGGNHVSYRCPEVTIPGSSKLATRGIECPDEKCVEYKGKTIKPRKYGEKHVALVELIETRGEGGQFICAPSPEYVLIQGSYTNLPVVTTDERDVLIGAAIALNEWHAPESTASAQTERRASRQSPADEYCATTDFRALLTRHGWRFVRSTPRGELLARPGKSGGWSAVLHDNRVLYVFSTNGAPFDSNRGYNAFQAYALLEHGGDQSAAAKAILRSRPQPQRLNRTPRKPPRPPQRVQCTPSEGNTFDRCVNFLKSAGAKYRTNNGRIYFDELKTALAPKDAYTISGAFDLLRGTPEADESECETTEDFISLSEKLYRIAAIRLLCELPDEGPADDAVVIDTIRDALIQLLVKPRVFYGDSGIALNASYASWLVMLKPADRWCQCYSHAVYGRATITDRFLAVKSQFLIDHSPKLASQFKNSSAAGRALLQHKLIVPAPDQSGSEQIKVNGRKLRVWRLASEIIEEACGSTIVGESE